LRKYGRPQFLPGRGKGEFALEGLREEVEYCYNGVVEAISPDMAALVAGVDYAAVSQVLSYGHKRRLLKYSADFLKTMFAMDDWFL